jgi:hypothetical protein
MMDVLGPFVSAGLFISREKAEEAWGVLNDAGIPATVVTDPGLLGKYSVSVEVERSALDEAVSVLRTAMTPKTEEESDPPKA